VSYKSPVRLLVKVTKSWREAGFIKALELQSKAVSHTSRERFYKVEQEMSKCIKYEYIWKLIFTWRSYKTEKTLKQLLTWTRIWKCLLDTQEATVSFVWKVKP
jgi:hypothetical protein